MNFVHDDPTESQDFISDKGEAMVHQGNLGRVLVEDALCSASHTTEASRELEI